MSNFNCYIGRVYKKKEEKFELNKFLSGLFDLLNPVLWAKFVFSIWRLILIPLFLCGIIYFKMNQTYFSVIILSALIVALLTAVIRRNKDLAIGGILFICVVGGFGIYQYYKGYQNAPVITNLKNIEFTTPSGDKCKIDNKGRIICNGKVIKHKDIKTLKKKGLNLRPSFFVAGFDKQPFGLGLEVFNLGKFNVDLGFFPLSTIGVGVSYDILNLKPLKSNISAGIMPVYDIKDKDIGVRFYLKWRF